MLLHRQGTQILVRYECELLPGHVHRDAHGTNRRCGYESIPDANLAPICPLIFGVFGVCSGRKLALFMRKD